MEQDTITLYRTQICWVAVYGGPHAVGVHTMFGTDQLPTAFAANESADTVRRDVAARNPGVDVLVAAPRLKVGERAEITRGKLAGTARLLVKEDRG